MFALDEMPIAYRNFQRGDLEEYILPDEGISKEEADLAENQRNEKKRREREFQKMASERSRSEAARQYYKDKAAEELETLKEEFENTKLILNAPPGSDFVPGLDDRNETMPIELEIVTKEKKNRKDEEPNDDNIESFIDAAEGELEVTREELLGGDGSETYALGTINATDATVSAWLMMTMMMMYLMDVSFWN